MNRLELRMVDALIDLKENHHVIGVKAEFEAEGTRLEEALRLKEVSMKAGLGLTLKIGGAEALRDMYECRVIGAERIVAPMVESAYALHKFLLASKLGFPEDEQEHVLLSINVETVQSLQAFPEMLALPEISELDGIVFGRVDFTGSMWKFREDVNGEKVLKMASDCFVQAKSKKLQCGIGGGVSAESLPFFRQLAPGHLDYYETRKVLFGCPGGLNSNASAGILKAVGFELLWLNNKRDYYSLIAKEDDERIGMLERRYKSLIAAAGGK